jgi:hypothetical protein
VLDRFVMAVRANYARMLEELPPPKDD